MEHRSIFGASDSLEHEKRLLAFAVGATPEQPQVPPSPEAPTERTDKAPESTEDADVNAKKRTEDADADAKKMRDAQAEDLKSEWQETADEQKVGKEAKKLMKRPNETPKDLSEFSRDRLYVREMNKYAEATNQWSTLERHGIAAHTNPDAVYLYKRAETTNAKGEKIPCLLAFAPAPEGSQAHDCQILNLETGTWELRAHDKFPQEFDAAATEYAAKAPKDLGHYKDNLDIETKILKNDALRPEDLGSSNDERWRSRENQALYWQYMAFLAGRGIVSPDNLPKKPVEGETTKAPEKISDDTYAFTVPEGATLALKFDTYTNWQYLSPNETAFGDFASNGFRVERDPKDRTRVIVKSQLAYSFDVQLPPGAKAPVTEKKNEPVKPAATPEAEKKATLTKEEYKAALQKISGKITDLVKAMQDSGKSVEDATIYAKLNDINNDLASVTEKTPAGADDIGLTIVDRYLTMKDGTPLRLSLDNRKQLQITKEKPPVQAQETPKAQEKKPPESTKTAPEAEPALTIAQALSQAELVVGRLSTDYLTLGIDGTGEGIAELNKLAARVHPEEVAQFAQELVQAMKDQVFTTGQPDQPQRRLQYDAMKGFTLDAIATPPPAEKTPEAKSVSETSEQATEKEALGLVSALKSELYLGKDASSPEVQKIVQDLTNLIAAFRKNGGKENEQGRRIGMQAVAEYDSAMRALEQGGVPKKYELRFNPDLSTFSLEDIAAQIPDAPASSDKPTDMPKNSTDAPATPPDAPKTTETKDGKKADTTPEDKERIEKMKEQLREVVATRTLQEVLEQSVLVNKQLEMIYKGAFKPEEFPEDLKRQLETPCVTKDGKQITVRFDVNDRGMQVDILDTATRESLLKKIEEAKTAPPAAPDAKNPTEKTDTKGADAAASTEAAPAAPTTHRERLEQRRNELKEKMAAEKDPMNKLMLGVEYIMTYFEQFDLAKKGTLDSPIETAADDESKKAPKEVKNLQKQIDALKKKGDTATDDEKKRLTDLESEFKRRDGIVGKLPESFEKTLGIKVDGAKLIDGDKIELSVKNEESVKKLKDQGIEVKDGKAVLTVKPEIFTDDLTAEKLVKSLKGETTEAKKEETPDQKKERIRGAGVDVLKNLSGLTAEQQADGSYYIDLSGDWSDLEIKFDDASSKWVWRAEGDTEWLATDRDATAAARGHWNEGQQAALEVNTVLKKLEAVNTGTIATEQIVPNDPEKSRALLQQRAEQGTALLTGDIAKETSVSQIGKEERWQIDLGTWGSPTMDDMEVRFNRANGAWEWSVEDMNVWHDTNTTAAEGGSGYWNSGEAATEQAQKVINGLKAVNERPLQPADTKKEEKKA